MIRDMTRSSWPCHWLSWYDTVIITMSMALSLNETDIMHQTSPSGVCQVDEWHSAALCLFCCIFLVIFVFWQSLVEIFITREKQKRLWKWGIEGRAAANDTTISWLFSAFKVVCSVCQSDTTKHVVCIHSWRLTGLDWTAGDDGEAGVRLCTAYFVLETRLVRLPQVLIHHLGTTQKSVLHHSHELLVTQFTITVGVKELEHNMDDMTV